MTKTFAFVSIAACLLAACSTTQPPPPAVASSPAPAPVTAPPPPPAPPPSVAAAPAPSASVPATQLPAHLDPKSDISTKRSIYFDYDDYSIKSQYAPVTLLHGKYLAADPTLAIRIEGNADERGGAEYNLALGQKRAEAVRRALQLQGVRDTQMEAISWGKQKPRATGHDEAAWAENRRVDLVYPAR